MWAGFCFLIFVEVFLCAKYFVSYAWSVSCCLDTWCYVRLGLCILFSTGDVFVKFISWAIFF